jgi:hypothetical protein
VPSRKDSERARTELGTEEDEMWRARITGHREEDEVKERGALQLPRATSLRKESMVHAGEGECVPQVNTRRCVSAPKKKKQLKV